MPPGSVVPLAASRQLAAGIPAAQLVLLDGCGHHPHVERPERVRAAVSAFLRAS